MKTQGTDSDYKAISAGNLLSSYALLILQAGAGQKIEQMPLCWETLLLCPMHRLKHVGCFPLEIKT